jgi:squalene-hopene/tetraprenyl-beta-curcumene cyclase
MMLHSQSQVTRWLAGALIVVSSLWTSPSAFAQPSQDSFPNEPLAESFSTQRAADYLDQTALQWMKERKCGSCHTTYVYLVARPSLKEYGGTAEGQVRAFFENRAANWDKNKPSWDTEVVATASALAIHDARTTGKLHPVTRLALDRMWTLQRKDGAWDWLKLNNPPMEHDDYFGATIAALGAGMAPDNYAATPSAQEGLTKLRKYFATKPAPDLHHRTMLLWASQHLGGLMTKKEQLAAIDQLLSVQQPDGGWNLPSLGNYKRHNNTRRLKNDKIGPSDGYGTGLVVYVLRQAGVPAKHERIQQGIAWLKANQRASGRWFTRSLSYDVHHYISHAGSAYAVMALAACDEK